jgi:hypothetical protein
MINDFIEMYIRWSYDNHVIVVIDIDSIQLIPNVGEDICAENKTYTVTKITKVYDKKFHVIVDVK